MSRESKTEPAEQQLGRVRQRMRTRRAVLQAAVEIMAAGRTPSVAEAADAAEVSRATAYRYFPSQEALLAQAALPLGLPAAQELFDGPGAPAEVEDRVVLVHEVVYDHVSARETQFRLFLRATLLQDEGQDRNLRPAFRVALLDAALTPLAQVIPAPEVERLRNALSVLIGTEAVIAARDVLQLDHATARAQIGWACRVLVRAAGAEFGAETRA